MKTQKLLLFLILVGTISLVIVTVGYAQTTGQAALVIDFGNGKVSTYCVQTGENVISGYDLLNLTGLPIEANHTAQGSAVCRIETTGCPADDCFCDSPPNYWSYWHAQEGQWVYATAGASLSTVEPGSVEGWAWGEGISPKKITLEQVCSDPVSNQVPNELSYPTDFPEEPQTTEATQDYYLFGILASVLGIGLVWVVVKR
jgi:hypothetical protein